MKLKKSVLFIIISLLALTSCGNNTNDDTSNNSASGGETEIVFPTYLAGENVGAVFFLPQVERFNSKYAGKYKITVQEVPQASYAEKIKQLGQQKKLPALIHAPGLGGIDVQWFKNVAVANNMCRDLSELLNSADDLKRLILDESLNFCTVDGKVVCMPLISIRPMGMFYNSDKYLPQKAINKMSMNEFISSLGNNKIAFQTADNGWTTSLFLSALLAKEDAGAKLLTSHTSDKLYDYNSPEMIKAVTELKSLIQSHGASNSVGAAYADSANAFMSNNAAIIANGPWMSSEFSESSSGKWSNGFRGASVRAALFPENIGLANTNNYGDFWVSANISDKEYEAVCEFLKFRYLPDEIEAYLLAEGGSAPKLDYSDKFLEKQRETPVLADLADAVDDDTLFVPNILDIMPSSVADTEFGKLLPKLIDNTLSPTDFCSELTRKAEETR